MKNTFRDLRPGDIVFAFKKYLTEIQEAKVVSIDLQYIKILLKSNDTISIHSNDWDRKSYSLHRYNICTSYDIALIHQYKAHRIEIEKSLNEIQLNLVSIGKNLQKTADIMVELVDFNDSIDWNGMLKKE